MEEENKTLLVITPGREQRTDSVFSLLVAETGEFLYSHFCSNYSFAPGDLYFHRNDRMEELQKRFGEVQVEFLEDTDITVEELIKRNNSWYQALPAHLKRESQSETSEQNV